MLGELEEQAHRDGRERARRLGDEERAGDAAPKRVCVVVVGRGADPSLALARPSALHRPVSERAAFGDAEDGNDEGLLGVAESEITAVGGRGGAAALARAVGATLRVSWYR